ncbi:MAG: hypothetical protein HY013_00180 [Candidatus Solibacter usitatus]|nr:hypothetical protein [Candidatus Solibacter usitatus]
MAQKSLGVPVVAIGASAGGLEAFTALLKALRTDTGMAFVLVQHMDPTHKSLLPTLLSRTTAMPVAEAKDGALLEANHVYVSPSHATLTIREGALRLEERRGGRNLPIDRCFCTLAEEKGGAAIGVLLSGVASDGTLGLRAIKTEGGITFAQDESSARHSGMPHSAIAEGCVDFVLPPDKIAAELERIARHPYVGEPLPAQADHALEGESGYGKICWLLERKTGVSFREYNPSTIIRRIRRRMALDKVSDLDEYLQLLRENPAGLEALYQDIFIHVTGFFRDSEAFEALQQQVLGKLRGSGREGRGVRAWVAGCSSGEEVYTLAMLLLEALGDEPCASASGFSGRT